MLKKNWFGVLILLSLILMFGIFFPEYMLQHRYYYSMLSNNVNLSITVIVLILSILPLVFLIACKKINIFKFLGAIFVSWFLASLLLIFVKNSAAGIDPLIDKGGWFLLFFNLAFLFVLAIIFVGSLIGLGNFKRKKIFNKPAEGVFDLILNLALWLIIFLIVEYVIVLLNIAYPLVNWLLFVVMIVISIKEYKNELLELFNKLIKQAQNYFKTPSFWAFLYGFLVVLSISYFMIWGLYSIIPYPTAWDANHAYLFYPKMWALHHWYYWWEPGMATSPFLWLMYITFWFSLFAPVWNSFTISPDGIATFMNFLSWLFVLWFFIGIINVANQFFWSKKYHTGLNLFLWWFLMLWWLFSWMGAFLVFVDNKTDLGVMSLAAVAIFSWLIMLHQFFKKEKEIWKYALLSGIFFATAVMAKPTAMLDAAIFGVFSSGVILNLLVSLWLIILIVWILAIGMPLRAELYINTTWGKKFSVIGVILTALWLLVNKSWQKIWWIIKPALFWIWGLIVTLLVLKIPYIVASNIFLGRPVDPANLIKRTFLAQDNKFQYADQSTADYNPYLILAQNSSMPQSNQGLYDGLKSPKWNSYTEDVGRYIGFGWRFFYGKWWSQLADNIPNCFSLDKDIKYLCLNHEKISSALQNLDNPAVVQQLQQLFDKVNSNLYLKNLINQFNESDNLGDKYSLLNQISQYYQSNSIKIVDAYLYYPGDYNGKIGEYYFPYYNKSIKSKGIVKSKAIGIPYKYIVPLNITFNWSLQNLSSYYTDIGYIWLIVLIIIFVGFVYALFKRENKLSSLLLATLGWWLFWIIIWGWILWYWIGLLIWSILAFSLFISYIVKDLQIKCSSSTNKPVVVFLIVILAVFLPQYVLNYIRIASQQPGSPFLWYKESIWYSAIKAFTPENIFEISKKDKIAPQVYGISTGNIQYLRVVANYYQQFSSYKKTLEQLNKQLEKTDNQLQKQKIETIRRTLSIAYKDLSRYFLEIPYSRKSILELQFSNYKKFLELANNRKPDEWIFIWWTYARYFINSQRGVLYDHFLRKLWYWFSDGNLQKSYLRLKDKNRKWFEGRYIKYIVIDPNIGTVVQGWGNKSLFDRFYGQVDFKNRKLIEDWVVTMLARLIMANKVQTIYSNSLPIKYAWLLPSQKLEKAFSGSIYDEIQIRSNAVILPYCFMGRFTSNYCIPQEDLTTLLNLMWELALERVGTLDFLQDIADVNGKVINLDKLKAVVVNIVDKQNYSLENIKWLTPDEVFVLLRFLDFIADPAQIQNKVQNYLIPRNIQSLIWVLEVK